ncbi:Dihydrofolate synthase [Acidisarcina polymorpha]|uniref:Dihydrofolate synthase/folylpolyglutamate synthase n=1 Tax=Acidisarcina polymorpha TaxID=2211140 RepID=A0A2Z5FXK3_9BACT|nr:folylpolyglutamate synthase/dihydrofolate synthase family protein [Acidisarcina polymorpha]AXC11613.1 Dihydrofolate synthase [Acidisarcina polymorpha]
MSYEAAIQGLQALAGELVTTPGAARREFRLEDMRILLAELGDPQLKFPSVLIAGTNGKGSTAATLASILAAAGYKTGLFTSPHLSRVNERVRILAGEEPGDRAKGTQTAGEIPDNDFAALYFRVDEAAARLVRQGRLSEHSSFFETVTALAFLHFAEAAVDIAILEVGMGGRLDATNVVEPLVSVITDISLDHTEWLGSTIRAIAREKAGILRAGGTMVTLPQHQEANEALGEIAVALGARGVSAAEYVPAPGTFGRDGHNRYPVSVLGETVEIDSPLPGQHQQRNLALAIAAAVELRNSHGYKLDASAISQGVHTARWPGRLELFPGGGERADVVLDVAHNPAGAWALRSGISEMPSLEDRASKTLIFGCLKDKALEEMAQILFPLFDRVLVTEVNSPRTASLEQMMRAAALTGSLAEAMPNAETALQRAYEITPSAGLIVVAGSVYLVGQLRGELAGVRT